MDINLHPAHYLCVLTILWILKDIQATAFCPLLKDRGLPHARMLVNKQKGIIRAQWGLPERRLLYHFWSLLLVSSKSVLSTSLNFISCKLLLKVSLEVQLFCSIYGEVPLTCTLLVMFSTSEWWHQRYQKCLRRSNKWSYCVRNWGVNRGYSAASCKAFLSFLRKVGPSYLYMTCTKVLEHLWIYFCQIQYTKLIYSIQ